VINIVYFLRSEVIMRIFQSMLLILTVVVLVSCSSAPASVPVPTGQSATNAPAAALVTTAPEPTELSPTTMPQAEAGGTPVLNAAQAQTIIENARQDLAKRLSLAATDIQLVSAVPVIWPDASLGCPQPDMIYAQMQTPGYLIKLNAADKLYEYHTDKGENMVECENGVPAASGAPGADALVEKAKQDLAGRLSIPVTGINLVESAAVTWPDTSLGCPAPDMMYAQILTPGYRIVLSAGDKHYEYHTGNNQAVVFCAHPK
jgi:hypothetical protein